MNKNALHFSSGFIAGVISCAMAFSGAFAYASGITAEVSRNRFIVNGEEKALSAYKIDGYNYFKLRDLGDALGFGVAWDGENKVVVIDTTVQSLEDIPGSKLENNSSFEIGNDVPMPGIVIRCSDGYMYEVKDISKYDANAFAEGPLPELPAEKENWDLMPKAEMPDAEARHFTAGDKEVKAWTFKKGMKAPACAGIIHSDFERGFIKAEVISYDDYIKYDGEKGAKENGKLRIEGKEYEMQDGDICLFRFNV